MHFYGCSATIKKLAPLKGHGHDEGGAASPARREKCDGDAGAALKQGKE